MAEKLKVLVPDRGNLQYMSFWLAKGAGYFADEGIDVELVVPPAPQQTRAFFEDRAADVAVLPPPVFLELIAAKVPVVLVANLLQNDPIELVVRRSVMTDKKLSPEMPLKARLEGLRGVKLGVAPHPPARLRALYASQGLDADKDATMVILQGKAQNAAFHDGKVDALYAHTPFLEQAMLHDDAVVLVDQAGGEVPELANRLIHALAVRRSLLDLRSELVAGLVRAIGRAEELSHRSQSEATAALAREMPERDRREIETIVRLYAPAIPATPVVAADKISASLLMFPAGEAKPDLGGIDLRAYVAADIPPRRAPIPTSWIVVAAVGIVALVLAIGAIVRSRRR